ncbi:topoisomerase DNA-binding C4 zinc finger domain-containing protein [Kiritimatiella glycovorans]|uniref:DNA topoisomerase type IA zn finger domain protein n=1 Tax=Kiritimatiella glycovorans TaxID=1307763 RepID=A0A0G3ELH9_9BACT|nr:topoisomerase DNA-binding C4 zinc finger domain-containing protein [Kiritimatiella glycovorans]AKJ64994.1 DNA topoisomerase type IA zn finger domain protein [Kiritimatiella glycovorans]
MSGKPRTDGGYRRTRSFQTATLIYDATYRFGRKHLESESGAAERMIRAARSGRLHIVGACRHSASSPRTELRRMNAARARLEELLLDFEDILRRRRLPLWEDEGSEAAAVQAVEGSGRSDLTDQEREALYARWLEHDDPAVTANAVICLIERVNDLLDRRIASMENKFGDQGGHREGHALARAGDGARPRENSGSGDGGSGSPPDCPRCGKPMIKRTAKTGNMAGKPFWGCSGYPACKGTMKISS